MKNFLTLTVLFLAGLAHAVPLDEIQIVPDIVGPSYASTNTALNLQPHRKVLMPTNVYMPGLQGYVNGLGTSWSNTKTIVVSPGTCVDSTGSNIIYSVSPLVAIMTNAGVNGLDTGSVTSLVHYAVYVIGNSQQTNPPASLFTLSTNAPTLPSGYDIFRRIGQGKTTADTNFANFFSGGTGKQRTIEYLEPNGFGEVLNNASATNWTQVDLSMLLPVGIRTVSLRVDFKTGQTGDTGNRGMLRPAGHSTDTRRVRTGVKNDQKQMFYFDMSISSERKLQYKVDQSGPNKNRIDINVVSYEDNL